MTAGNDTLRAPRSQFLSNLIALGLSLDNVCLKMKWTKSAPAAADFAGLDVLANSAHMGPPTLADQDHLHPNPPLHAGVNEPLTQPTRGQVRAAVDEDHEVKARGKTARGTETSDVLYVNLDNSPKITRPVPRTRHTKKSPPTVADLAGLEVLARNEQTTDTAQVP